MMRKIISSSSSTTTSHQVISSSTSSGNPPEPLPPSTTTNPFIGKTITFPNSNNTNGSKETEKSSKSNTSVTIDEIIAEGGFGIVFLAKSKNNTEYALKRILVNNQHDLNVAMREIQFMTQLNHPNLLHCTNYSVNQLTPDVTEILMLTPFIKNNLLSILNAKLSSKSHLTESEIYGILIDITSGVSRLHQCTTPVIHRDLKIENILEDNGRYVICDFGSATGKVWDPDKHSITSINEELEKYTTLAYRAPEMIDIYSGRGPITTKSDIWALGILLYKICFYTTPFGDSILAIQSANLQFPPTSPFPPHIHALISYLLTPDQNIRPDIYQVSVVLHQLNGTKNPIQNINNVSEPPNIIDLIGILNNKLETAVAAKPATPNLQQQQAQQQQLLETSVTPRQRPKGNIANVINPNSISNKPIVVPVIPGPPKSPKPTAIPNPNSLTVNSGSSSPTKQQHRRNVSDSSAAAAAVTAAIGAQMNSSGTGSRDSIGDKSTFVSSNLQVTATTIHSASSDNISSMNKKSQDFGAPAPSWNPFDYSHTHSNMPANNQPQPETGVPEGIITLTEASQTFLTEDNSNICGFDEDPFENAPFDLIPPTSSSASLDLFGLAPFQNNPFLVGNFQTSSTTNSSLITEIEPAINNSIINNELSLASTNNIDAAVKLKVKKKKRIGVTNLSFED